MDMRTAEMLEPQGPAEDAAPEIDFDFNELRAKVAVRKLQPVQKLSDLHEALADYMLVNPGSTYREMGAHFGYTVAWLCTIVTSDMFQAYFAKRRQEVSAFVAASLPKKLEAAAHLAVEKVIDVLERTEDAELILDSFDKVLHRYGYAPNAKNGGAQAAMQQAGNIQNNFYISKEDFETSRGQLLENHTREADGGSEPANLPPPST